MDLPIQFNSIAKRILQELRALNGHILVLQKQAETIAKECKAQNERQNAAPVLRSELQIPEAVIRDWERDNAKKTRREKFAIGVSVITFFAIVGYAILVYFQWREMIGATDAAQQAVAESRRNRIEASKSLDAAVQRFHLEQRAWVGPVEVRPPQFVVNGKPVYVKAGERTTLGVYATNSGKTPALDMHTRTNLKAMKTSEKFFADYPAAKVRTPPPSLFVLQPGMKITLDSLPSGVSLSDEHIQGFDQGNWVLYFYGDIRYNDVFGKHHTTTFCVRLTQNLSGLINCDTYNSAD